MKKLLMNAAIATGFALFAGNAFAADAGASVTSIGFESTPQGQLDVSLDDQGGGGTTYWNDDGDDESTIVTNYTDTFVTKPDNRPDLFAGTENNIFLKIDSQNGIERYMATDGAEGGSVSLDNDYFVDMNVQFTVSDEVLKLGENTDNDKLAIWLYGPDGAETNLVITAAELDGDKEPTLKNYVIGGVDIQPDTWYRLTVKAVGEAGFPPKFNVYIDGDEDKLEAVATLAADGTKTSLGSAVSDFYSLVKYAVAEPTTYTLSSVTFQGVGALDDLAFTTNAPSFFPVEVAPFAIDNEEFPTLAAAIDAAEDGDVITMKAGNTSDIEMIEEPVRIDLNGFTLTFSEDEVEFADDVVFVNSAETAGTVAGVTLLVEDGTLTIGASSDTGAITVTAEIAAYTEDVKVYGSNTKPTLSEQGDYKGWSTETDEDGYYYVVEGGEEPAGGYDNGAGGKFVIAEATETALKNNLPAGKTLASTVSETSSMTYAQAYALGLWDAEAEEVEDLEATISFDEDGNVVVSLANAPATGYLVTCKVYEKASLTAEWPAEPTKTYTYGSEQPITPSATAGFYKVEVTISNAVLNNND